MSDREALMERLLRDLRQGLLLPRRLRCNPRVVKSRRAKFPARTQAHRSAPKLEKAFPDGIVPLKQSTRYREPLPLKPSAQYRQERPLKRTQKVVLLT